MKQQPKYRNYYKCALQEGSQKGLRANRELEFELEHRGTAAVYITKVFDTRDEDTTYHRLFVDCDLDQIKLEVIVAVSDSLEAPLQNGTPIREFLANPQVSASKKEAALRRMRHVRRVNVCDMLLHELKGRYVWIYLAAYPSGSDAQFTLRGLRLEYPRYSFTEYFPEIYQGNDFFDRYIAVFQTMFLDEERRVDEVPRMLDYEGTDDATVEELAGWLGIDNQEGLFTPAQLRHMIRNIDIYQGAKGTRTALKKLIQLVTGITPSIIEPFQWNQEGMSASRLQMYKNLYGETGNHFCVILNVMGKNRAAINERKLEQLIEAYSMVGTRFRIVLLDRCSYADGHCYLGINSTLSTPEIAAVDKAALGAHLVVG